MILATNLMGGRAPTIRDLQRLRDVLLVMAIERDEKPQPYELRVNRRMTEMTLTTEGVQDQGEWFVAAHEKMIFSVHVNAYIVGGGTVGCPE